MNAIVGALVEPESVGGSPRPLSQGSEWTFELIQSYDDAICLLYTSPSPRDS